MKKTLMLVLIVALAFSCFAAVLTAGASTPIAQGSKTDGRNYFSMPASKTPTESWNFDGEKPSNVANRHWNLTVADGVLTVNGCAPGYAMQAWYYETQTIYKQGNTYFVEFDVLTNEYINAMCFELFDGWGVLGSANVSEQIGIAIADGAYTVVNGDVAGGWGGTTDVTNGSFVATAGTNGYTHIYFEFTPRATLKNIAQMLICIKGTDVDGTTVNAVAKFDNFAHGIVNKQKYYTVDWDVDFNNFDDYDQAFEVQPVWAEKGLGSIDADWIDGSKCMKFTVNAGSSNAGVGGFQNDVQYIDSKKAVKHAGITYFQYDIAFTGCSMVNVFTGNPWTEIKYENNKWSVAGVVSNISHFNVDELENGYRVSYFIDLTGTRDDTTFGISVSSDQGGAVYLDNLVIAYEDYTAYLGTGTYNYNNTQDVAIDFDAKGKDVVSVKLDDATLTEEDYAIADGKLTVKAAKLAGSELGKNYTLSVVTSASETPVTTEIAQYDNREGLYAEYDGGELANVTYNGTTIYNGEITLTLKGNIADGDEVTVTKDVALKSKDASNNSVVISNIALAGKDAAKYKLNNTENIEIPVYVLPVQLTITDPTIADKTYNGTAEAEVTAGKLQGILEGDEVTLESATGVFNSKDVATANKVTVSYVIAGKDSANYIAPVNSEVTKTIAKANITVTANAISKTEGEADPELTYTVDGAEQGTQLSGKLARAAGETAGEYDITVGTLAHDNYNINFVGAKFTIKAKQVEESTGCFGVVGTASVAAFALVAAAAVVVCKRKSK